MLSSLILSPSDCSPQELADFEKLVIEGGAVDPEGLAQRISNASRLLFLRNSNGQLVGVGALKHPRPSYRNGVFAKAGANVPSYRYRVELGWVVVAKSYQGRRLSARIIAELLALTNNQNVFATTRADDRAARFAAAHGFAPHGNPYPSGRGYDLVLYIYNAATPFDGEHEPVSDYRAAGDFERSGKDVTSWP
ncbi:MAG TPA: GNAT family N-acetyltransferase [Candidatus Udaeobacter sp.]|nr:GNAT family N-acetyltransferase [Candidatus Udaeobacter sp.]